MSRYDVEMVDGQRISVIVAERLEFLTPVRTRQEAQAAIAQGVAATVQPGLRLRLAEKRIVRDEKGQITRAIEVPGATPAQQAMQIGLVVAAAVMEGVEDPTDG